MDSSRIDLFLGDALPLDGTGPASPCRIDADDLVTHACVVGMTGSGKTGAVMVLVEEALRAHVPVLMIDVKGDLPNLALTLAAQEDGSAWVDARIARRRGMTPAALAEETQAAWRESLEAWGVSDEAVASLRETTHVRVITPGTSAGEMLHVLSSLETPTARWSSDPEGAREALSASISLLLRLVGRDPDPARSRDHVLLAVLAERRLRGGEGASVASLLADLENPPIAEIGAMSLDAFLPKRERHALATALNALLASPTFESWRQGAPLDVEQWLGGGNDVDGKTRATIVSVAHLDDEERSLVLGVLLEEVLAWVRAQSGTSSLRALIVFDEVFGFVPPHPASPPTKRPIVALVKQARAFGVGVVLATQNPMDVDYRLLSNAGTWLVGRLSTDADRARVVEGLRGFDGGADLDARELGECIKSLAPRWFVLRSVHARPHVRLLQTRTSIAWLRGPMTRAELRRLREGG